MAAELFKLNEDYLVDLNREWISTIPEFNKIIRRDRGSEGDSDGRRKLQARKEFTYIYHTCDYRSQYENYTSSEKIYEAKRNAELPDDFVPDPDLQEAINKYLELRDTESIRTVRTLKQSLVVTRKILSTLVNRLQELIVEIPHADTDNEDGNVIAISNEIIEIHTKISKILTELPKMTRAIADLESVIKKELSDDETLRADSMKGVEEDP